MLNHRIGVCLGQARLGEFACASANRSEKRSLWIIAEATAVDIGVRIGFEIVMARHRMNLAAFFVQANPKAAVLDESVFDPHADRRADAREGINHQAD